MPDAGYDWISRNDGQFKAALDHTKYSVRHPNLDIHLEREKAANFLHDLNTYNVKKSVDVWRKLFFSRYGNSTFCSTIF